MTTDFEDHLYWRELRRIYQASKPAPLPAAGTYEGRARERAQVLAQDPAERRAYEQRWGEFMQHFPHFAGAEHRSRSAASFPRRERAQNLLAIMAHQLEKEERDQ